MECCGIPTQVSDHVLYRTPCTSATSTVGDAGWVVEKGEQPGGPWLESIYSIETKQRALLFPKSTLHLPADQLPRAWPVVYMVFLERAVTLHL